MRQVPEGEDIILDGFHEYTEVVGVLYETTDEYIEVFEGEQIYVGSEVK